MWSWKGFGVIVRVDSGNLLDDAGVLEFGRAPAEFDGTFELGHSK